MTRELKLAMVIGFALLLVLAIGVSDHFSTGAADHSTLVASAQPRLADATPPVAVRRTAGSASPDGTETPRRDAVGPSFVDPPLAATTRRGPAVRPAGDRVAATVPAASISTILPRGDVPSSAAAETPRTHRVAEGESLSSIASAFYGDPGRWDDLAAANRDRLPDPDRMRVGLLLVIPEPEDLGMAEPAPSPPPGAAVRDPLVETTDRIHVVVEGETLSEIAAARLGSARRWPEIVAANRDRIADPDRVRPGTELRLP